MTLRAITVPTGTVAADPGPRPVLDWLPISALVIDDAYQRPIDDRGAARIERIAEAFHWSKFSPMMVADLRDGRFAVIDGQHRAHAAALCGMTHVPALVVQGAVGSKAQAHAFVAVNGTALPLSQAALFRAALGAGEAWAVALRDAVAAAGCEAATYQPASGRRRPFVIYAIGTLRRYVEAGRPMTITRGLAALKAHDTPSGRVALYDGYILKPWLAAVDEVEASIPVLTAVLDRRDPFKVLEAAQRKVGPHLPYGREAVAIWTAMIRDLRKGAAA